MEKKLTKREMFSMIMELNADNSQIVEFCEHEIELLERKKSNGNAKANIKVAENLDCVYVALAEYGEPVTATELIASGKLANCGLENEVGLITTQKVSSYLNKLIACGKAKSEKIKKKTYFSIVDEE